MFDLIWIKSHPDIDAADPAFEKFAREQSLIAFALCWCQTIDVEQIASREDCDIRPGQRDDVNVGIRIQGDVRAYSRKHLPKIAQVPAQFGLISGAAIRKKPMAEKQRALPSLPLQSLHPESGPRQP